MMEVVAERETLAESPGDVQFREEDPTPTCVKLSYRAQGAGSAWGCGASSAAVLQQASTEASMKAWTPAWMAAVMTPLA